MKKLIGIKKTKTAVFISGKGSNLENLIKFSKKKISPISINLIISNTSYAKGLKYSKKYNIQKKVIFFKNKKLAEKKIFKILFKKNINLICLAGFSVGVVDEKKILNKKKIVKNNLILAIPSSGVHSNGYSLIRNILNKKKINLKKTKFLKKELLKPTKIYVKEVLSLIKKNLINGCANITGGGISDNIKRIIPDRLTANINLNKIKIKKIFSWLKENNIEDKEMLKTFNCGVGFCLIIDPKNLDKVKKFFTKDYEPYVIGKIILGKNKMKLNEKINWS